MILRRDVIIREISDPPQVDDPLCITPLLSDGKKDKLWEASIDLRLGCWFCAFRSSNIQSINVYSADSASHESRLGKYHYVPYGKTFVMHPRSFALGVTLEWVRMPKNRAAYVVGKSSWGRSGLIIATATGVHPGFSGCLTLELSNVGEVPVVISPGTEICQLFVHDVCVHAADTGISAFSGKRKPVIGTVKIDKFAQKLAGFKG